MSSKIFLKNKKEKLGYEVKKDVKSRKTVVGFQGIMLVKISKLMRMILYSRTDICRRKVIKLAEALSSWETEEMESRAQEERLAFDRTWDMSHLSIAREVKEAKLQRDV